MATNSVALPHMTSVERISKLPVVEHTYDLAASIYGRVKDVNPMINTVLSSAETTVRGAVDRTIPIANRLEGPIKVVDSVLCSSLDFVETNLPVVKLPPDEMYKTTKEYVSNIQVVKCAHELGEQGVRKAVECACYVSEYGTHKLNALKDSLAASDKNKNIDARTVISMYLYTLLHVLTVFSAWVGLGPVQRAETATNTDAGNNKKVEGQSNGNVPNNHRETNGEAEEQENTHQN